MNDKSICSLEMTSSGIKLVVGYMLNNQVHILHCLCSTRTKLIKGGIVDSDEMKLAILELVNSASKSLNDKIDSVVLGIPSIDLTVEQDSATTTTTDPSSIVSAFDGSNCLHMIEKQRKDSEGLKEVFDVVPYSYVIDNNTIVKKFPTGKKSNSLVMQADVELAPSVMLKAFKKAVNDAGLKILKVVDTTTAAVNFISSYQKTHNEFIYIDLGARLTTFGFVFDGRLLKAETINFGSDDITDALVRTFNLDYQTALRYKEVYGLSDDPSFEFKTKEGIKLSQIKGVIEKCLNPLVDGLTQFEMTFDASARNLFIMSGGGSSLNGLNNFLVDKFKSSILLFTPTNFGTRDKAFTNCVAMINYYANYELKTSPSRPVDLTLTRIMPTTLNQTSVKENNKDEDSSKPANYSGLNDERL